MIRNVAYRVLQGRLKHRSHQTMHQPHGTKFTVSVEGNIGSGKSSLLNFFHDLPHVEEFKEPIEQWTNVGGTHNALQLLYEDPVRWCFTFNQYAMLTRLQIHLKKIESPVKMIERSLFSTRYVFVEYGHAVKRLTDLEYMILNEHFNFIEAAFKELRIDLFVYLQVSPEICLERIRKRSRLEESSISLEFLQELHKLHEDLFVKKTRVLPAPVLVIDGNSDLKEMYKVYEKKKSTILGGNV